MTQFLKSTSILAALVISLSANATNNYTVTSSTTASAANFPSSCTDCVITIANDAVVTLDQDMYLQNTTINGGTIVVAGKKLVFYSASTFNGVTVNLNNGANLVNSGALTIKNSAFTFSKNSWATVYTSITMTNSTWSFLDNSWMEATGGTFTLKASSLTAGDGSNGSAAYIKFNGATLNINDASSFLTMLNSNNYYFNWSSYQTNKGTVKTTDNKMNCGTSGKNACSSPTVYGPSTLNVSGASANATLPVKLSAFNAKLSADRVVLTWTTATEKNADYFEIQKSEDGKTWSVIGKVAAKSNSTETVNYSFVDGNMTSATANYRLRIVDIDQNFEFSPIKSVKTNQVAAAQMKIYPNPTTDRVVISTTDNTASLRVQLMSLSGQVLKQANGTGSQTMSVSEFNTGSYLVRVTDAAGNSNMFKLLVTK